MRARRDPSPKEVPDDNSRQNLASLQRSKQAQHDIGPAGDARVPDSVREALSSSGRSLDSSIQRAMEERMGELAPSKRKFPGQVLDVVGSGGIPLDASVQRALEERLDADFSYVRIRTDVIHNKRFETPPTHQDYALPRRPPAYGGLPRHRTRGDVHV